MVVYLTPVMDQIGAQDVHRLTAHNVRSVVLSFQVRTTVQEVVHLLTNPKCKALVLPDDYHRHNDLIEAVKACALHCGIPMRPVTRYLNDNAPAPATASVHANAAAAGVGANLLPAAAG